ncbi:MAG: FAD-dependent monooxygenase [Anaerolineales bacterium]|nr:FAD-dependent monooxygenase [Anaerolineales bacterium]
MKILILGGGPGGLYSAILLKKANPAHDIHIVERNPAGATYGWGVVFSDRTINTFREADFPSYERITKEFVTWTAIDIHYKGEIIRADGHDFAGMSRRRLLQILQDRCRELGIQMTFEHEAILPPQPTNPPTNQPTSPETLLNTISTVRTYTPGVTPFPVQPADYDLIIAADGVNSAVRKQFTDVFQPTLTLGQTKYIWFGTDRLLDAFTFLFKENEHGLFQVHAYPFDGTTSTFIVECAEDVWRRAGLDKATEADSIAYCQNLFSDFLGKARLLSNRSLWVNFVHVVCKKWRHTIEGTPLVLLGDAAHTAHFSIGSGTKLAMDAAIALAQALETAPNVNTALRVYESERRPRAESLQAAALVSQRYFETLKRYTNLAPQPFAFQLLTRSGRIHYDNLRTRDPQYVETVDRTFAGNSAGNSAAPPPLHTPFPLRGVMFPNRLASRNPASGAGLLLTPPVAVSPEGRITPDDPCLYDEIHLATWITFVDAAHARGQKTGILLNHAGRRGAVHPARAGIDRPIRDPWPLLAPSPLPYHRHSPTPRAMTPDDLAAVCESFVRAARLAHQAGFDLLQLHMAHGYLLASFLSPLTNHRPDEYGGTLENRLRYPLQILTAVRAVWDKPLAIALNVDDWAKGGLILEDSLEIARAFHPHLDLLQPLAGQTVPDDDSLYASGYLTPHAERLRHATCLPILLGGHLTTSGEVNTILAGGRADLCVMST